MNIRFDDEQHKRRRDYMREYLRSNPEKNRQRVKKYRQEHYDKAYAAVRTWHRQHPESQIMHSAISKMLESGGRKKDSKARRYLGCSPGFLRGWLEAQFHDGMTWANYGTVWVVDHIVPLKWWDVGTFPQHLLEASHYSNLQPMFKRENNIKSAKFAG